MIRRLVLGSVLLSALALPLRADFGAVARALDSHPGVSRATVPFMGLARLVVWLASPEGVHDFQMATFEGADRLDARQLRHLMDRHAGDGFTPLVQTWSKKKNEWSFIYGRPSSSGMMELMLLTHDREDTVLIRVKVDSDVVAQHIEHHPDEVRNVARR